MIDDFLLNLLASLAYDLLKALPTRFRGERDDLLRDLREELRHQTQVLEALQALLVRLGGERVVRVEGNVAGSVIITGDGNAVSVTDGGALAQRWSILQLDDDQTREQYYREISALYQVLTFPLYGLDFSTALTDVYLHPSLYRLRYGLRSSANWRYGDPVPSLDELMQNPGPVALLGMLGDGKTTILQYLTWLYAHRPSDRPHWRLGELVPFLLTANDLAILWQDETDLVTACSRAVTRFYHYPLLNPYLVERALQTALKQGTALILMDALDEYQPSPVQKRQDFVIALSRRWSTDPFRQNFLILSSRPYAFLRGDFLPYALQEIGETGAKALAYRLGKILLHQQESSAERLAEQVQDLVRLVAAPQMRPFLTPFYVTLLVVAVCRNPDFVTGLAQAGNIRRWADLYRFFLHQTFCWERDKSGSTVEEDAALLALAHIAWQSFTAQFPRLSLDLSLPFSEQECREALNFWKRTGLIGQNEITGEWTFVHAGFRTFGVALWLKEALQRGRLDEIERLQRDTLVLDEWDEVWKHFYGL